MIVALLALAAMPRPSLADVDAASGSASSYIESLSPQGVGAVKVRRAETPEWAEAQTGDELDRGDSVQTGAGASCTLRVAGVALVHLEANSTFTLPDSAENVSTIREVELETGAAWTTVRKLASGESFTVGTKNAVGGVRGTQFLTSYDPDTGDSNWDLLEGELSMKPAGPKGKVAAPVTLRSGFRLGFSKDGRARDRGPGRIADVTGLKNRFQKKFRANLPDTRKVGDLLRQRPRYLRPRPGGLRGPGRSDGTRRGDGKRPGEVLRDAVPGLRDEIERRRRPNRGVDGAPAGDGSNDSGPSLRQRNPPADRIRDRIQDGRRRPGLGGRRRSDGGDDDSGSFDASSASDQGRVASILSRLRQIDQQRTELARRISGGSSGRADQQSTFAQKDRALMSQAEGLGAEVAELSGRYAGPGDPDDRVRESIKRQLQTARSLAARLRAPPRFAEAVATRDTESRVNLLVDRLARRAPPDTRDALMQRLHERIRRVPPGSRPPRGTVPSRDKPPGSTTTPGSDTPPPPDQSTRR